MTHVGLVCDVPEAQRVLPQIVIGNFHTLPKKAMAALLAKLPDNVHLLRRKSAWNDKGLYAIIIRMIAEALAPFAGAYQPILLHDAFRGHIAWNVFAAFTRVGIWPIIVPALMTSLLQPLDTHVFAEYKWWVQELYQRALAESVEEGEGDDNPIVLSDDDD